MGEHKAIRLTSPTNAWALGAQAISFLIPLLAVTGVYDPAALGEISPVLSEVWQWVLLVFAAVAATATLLLEYTLGDGRRMESVLSIEMVATAVVALCYLILFGALVDQYGFLSNPLTQLIIGGLGLTAAGRVGQILWERWKYHRAKKSRPVHIARVEAIASPKES
ncbi:hypothetical protein [Microbacterium sp. UBA837]|uniref:hypothetical protein n=1 Tax=Microbacterium sp. UBA837 TaxID=1946956 RepID=UPI0025DC7352|nr:hypothetical protein [Microbacterium sp. UBA837]